MLSKKLEWLFERAPAELIPVGTKQKMAKKVSLYEIIITFKSGSK